MSFISFSCGELGLVFIFVADLEYIELGKKNFAHMCLSKANRAISFELHINTIFTEKEQSSKFIHTKLTLSLESLNVIVVFLFGIVKCFQLFCRD